MTAARFLTLEDVSDVLNISQRQTYAMVRSGELPAIQVGGRGQWRVERSKLEEYIAGAYERTAAQIASQTPAGREADIGSGIARPAH